MLEPKIEAIPEQLKQHPYWNGCLLVAKKDGYSKPSIQPCWKLGSSNDLSTWSNFDAVCQFYKAKKGQIFKSPKITGPLAGIGILLADGTLTTIDLDHCIKSDGTLEIWAQEIVNPLAAITYAEISISGTGIHIYMFASKQGLHCRRKQIEIYNKARFMVVTGHQWPGSQDTIASGEDVQKILNEIEASISGDTPSLVDKQRQEPKPPKIIGDMSDTDLLKKARYSRDGREFSNLFDIGDISNYPSASEADLALANKLAFWTAKDADKMDSLMRQSALLKDAERIAKWDKIHKQGQTYGEITITKAIQDTDKVYAPAARLQNKKHISTEKKSDKALPQKPGKYSDKIPIEYAPGQMSRMKRELEAALCNTTYQLGETLARIINVPRKEPHENEITYITKIDPLSADSALSEAEEVSSWYKIKADKKTGELVETPINAPLDVVKQLLSWKKWRRLPLISGIVNCPVMKGDGSIIDKPGYDKKTCLYAYFNPAEFPKVSIKPSDAEIKKSHELLISLLSEFPFKIDDSENANELAGHTISRSVALAMLLTPLIQKCLDNLPLFAITAPTPGTGKSYLADIISIILCGARADFMSFTPDETEFEKAIFAKLLEGAQCCLIDNIDRPLNSAKLNGILTQQRMSGRVLGLSKNASVDTHCQFLATGNNLEIVGDLIRRTLLCSLDARMEQPAEREFANANLHEWALKNRGQIVQAGLSILRAHYLAGLPGSNNLKPFNSFNQWSKWVRGAVVWLGEPDPVLSQENLKEADSERQQFLDVITAWHNAYGNKWKSTKDLLEPPYDADLHAALENAVPFKRELDSRFLGRYLSANKDRVINKKQLVGSKDTHTKTMLWQIRNLN